MIVMSRPAPAVVAGRETIIAQVVSTLPGELGTRELIDFGRLVGIPHHEIQHAGYSCEHLMLADEPCVRAARLASAVDHLAIARVMDRKRRNPLQPSEATLQ